MFGRPRIAGPKQNPAANASPKAFRDNSSSELITSEIIERNSEKTSAGNSVSANTLQQAKEWQRKSRATEQ